MIAAERSSTNQGLVSNQSASNLQLRLIATAVTTEQSSYECCNLICDHRLQGSLNAGETTVKQ